MNIIEFIEGLLLYFIILVEIYIFLGKLFGKSFL